MSFFRNLSAITNPHKHTRSSITANGNTKKSERAGKLQITQGSQLIFDSALVVPSFKDDLISVARLTKWHNVVSKNDAA